ncbi:MAG: glycosyltransferase [Chitinivibrionales bacterium]|nr:glycosyltransferase [Chitinivibrionales bacterium]MBD3357858.1 glycosyltransferase [Chitinivibrionales bacterium]
MNSNLHETVLSVRNAHTSQKWKNGKRPADKVAFIIVTYNSGKWIKDCLAAIINQKLSHPVITIVDNGSKDETRGIVKRQRIPNLQYLEQPSNLGYGKAANIGIRLALESGAEYIAVMNPDIQLRDNAIDEMIRIHSGDDTLCPLTPLHTSYNADRIEPCALWFLRLSKKFSNDIVRSSPLSHYYATPFINGAFMLFSRAFLLKVGAFDEMFFFYGEDNDLCRRSRLFGYSPCVVLTAHAFHWHGTENAISVFRKRQSYIGGYRYTLKEPSRPFMVNILLAVLNLFRYLFREISSARIMPLLLKDFIHTITDIGSIHRSRRHDIAKLKNLRDHHNDIRKA